MSTPYIVLGIPSGDQWQADTANCVVAAAGHLQSQKVRVRINNIRNSRVSELRNQIVANALDRDATHIMWIDSDMAFPSTLPHRLLGHNKSIVGCTYRMRRPDFKFVHDELLTPASPDPMRMIAALPGGMTLVNTHVYHLLGERWYDEVDGKGEDVSFCTKARAAGIDVWLDTVGSHYVSHVGQLRVPYDMPDEVLNWLSKTQQ